MIKQGDKVVCVDSSGWHDPFTLSDTTEQSDPKKGEIFTVHSMITYQGIVYLVFVEITKEDENGVRECYSMGSFRKLQPKGFKDITKELANTPLIQEGIERIIIEPEKELV